MDLPEVKNPFVNAKIVADNFDSEIYHADVHERGSRDFVASNSMIGAFAPNPQRWVKGYEGADSKAKTWGSLLDCKALTPQKFKELYAVQPETYPDSKTGEIKPWSGNAKFCKQWKAECESGGYEVITRKMDEESNKAVARLFADELIADVLKNSRRQVFVTAEYHDKATGLVIPCKSLLDIVPNVGTRFGRSLIDLKSGRNGSHKAWRKQVYNFGWHRQAAWHWDIYVKATGEDRVDFRHAISENVPPYEPGRRTLSLQFVDAGRRAYVAGLVLYAKCLAENKWPSYDDIPNNFDGWPICEPEPYMVQDITFESPEPEPELASSPVNIDEIVP